MCIEVRVPPREKGKKNTLPAPDRMLQRIDGATEGISKVLKSDVRDA